MNTKRVQAAEGVILAALKTKQTAAGIAIALESACLLQSPESAAEQRREVIAERDAQVVAWLAKKAGEYGSSNRDSRTAAQAVGLMADKLSRGAVRDDETGVSDLYRLRSENHRLRARVAELEAERHSTNEALSKAVERLAELETERAELIRQRDQIAMDTMRAITLPTVYSCLVCGEGLDDENISDFCSDRCSDEYAELGKPSPTCAFKNPHEPHTNRPGQPTEYQCPGVPRPGRQQEDPHDGPNHRDYALGHAEGRRQLSQLLGLPVGWPAEDSAKPHPSEGELAEQRHLVDPLDHALEALAPLSVKGAFALANEHIRGGCDHFRPSMRLPEMCPEGQRLSLAACHSIKTTDAGSDQ